MKLAAQNRGSGALRDSGSSPVGQHKRVSISTTSASSLEYEPGELPADFHRKVVDLEIKVEMNGMSQNNNQEQIKMLSDLMQLYSVSKINLLYACFQVCNMVRCTVYNNQDLINEPFHLPQAAIEHYNRTRDEENYSYYIEKL